jgi:TFIIH basal transcription factor complex TTD-A subunit
MQGERCGSYGLSQLLSYREGVLVECDPSIKAIIIKIDEDHSHAFIIENIDDEHVLVKTHKHEELKKLLKEVSRLHWFVDSPRLTPLQRLKDTVKEAEESSESE